MTTRLAAAAISAAVLWAWLDVPRIGHPMGSDWAQYFTVAEIIWFDDPHLYPPFRKPFFGMLLGMFGEHMGYFEAAQFFGRLSAVLIVIAAGIGAWALVGPIAGAVAAGIVVLMPLVMDGALWVNNYPLLGASTGLAFAAGAAFCRWPRLHWALLAGTCASVAHALDVRGAVVVPAVLMLMALGLPWGAWRRVGALSLACLIPLGALHAYEGWLVDTFDVPQLSLSDQMRVQRQAVLEPIKAGTMNDAALERACAAEPQGETGPIAGLQAALSSVDRTSCAAALQGRSMERLQGERSLPALGTIWLGALALLPMAWRRRDPASRWGLARSSAVSAVVLGVPFAAVFVGMSWVHYHGRYLLPFSFALAMLVPVAWGRVVGFLALWTGPKQWMGPVVGVLSLAWAIIFWPGVDARELAQPEEAPGADHAAGVMAQWARAEIRDGDFVLDCAGLALDYLLLPQRIGYERFAPGEPACDAFLRSPGTREGRTFLITLVQPETADGAVALRPSLVATLGWTPVDTPGDLERYRLWIR